MPASFRLRPSTSNLSCTAGPTQRAFATLEAPAQDALRRDLVELQTVSNTAGTHSKTEVPAEYLEVVAVRH